MSEKYNDLLNQDRDGIRTPAERDSSTGKWVINTKDSNTIYGLSTDNKPVNVRKGIAFFEIDTSEVYVFDGNAWRLI